MSDDEVSKTVYVNVETTETISSVEVHHHSDHSDSGDEGLYSTVSKKKDADDLYVNETEVHRRNSQDGSVSGRSDHSERLSGSRHSDDDGNLGDREDDERYDDVSVRSERGGAAHDVGGVNVYDEITQGGDYDRVVEGERDNVYSNADEEDGRAEREDSDSDREDGSRRRDSDSRGSGGISEAFNEILREQEFDAGSDRGGSERGGSDRGGSERGGSVRGGSIRGSERGGSIRGSERGGSIRGSERGGSIRGSERGGSIRGSERGGSVRGGSERGGSDRGGSDGEESDKEYVNDVSTHAHVQEAQQYEEDNIYEEVDDREEHTYELERSSRSSRGSESDKEESEARHTQRAHDKHDGHQKRAPTTPTASSGKFTLRTLRNADPHHVLRNIRTSSSDNNPELDELVTIIRSADDGRRAEREHSDEQKAKQKKMESFITSKLIHKFEQGIGSGDESSGHEDGHDVLPDLVAKEKYKTTVVKGTVKTPTSPVSPKSPTSPLSPGAASAHRGVVYTSQNSSSSSSSSSSIVEEGGVPAWKTEIEMRKKTKQYVQPQKPKEPLKMSEVPEWKRQLQEKNRIKKANATDEVELTLPKILLNPSAASLPLKVEMERLKRDRDMAKGGGALGVGGGMGGVADMPEWARLADEKKRPVIHQTDVNGNHI